MKFGATTSQSASTSHGDNVLQLRDNMDADADVMHNVVALHAGPILNIVEAIDAPSVDIAHDRSVGSAASCIDGVCSIDWKPRRPTAA